VYVALNLLDPGHITFRKACSINETIADRKIAVIIRNPFDRLFSTYNYAYFNVKEKPFSMVQKLGNFNTYLKFLMWFNNSKTP
jgi:hypothetical protein